MPEKNRVLGLWDLVSTSDFRACVAAGYIERAISQYNGYVVTARTKKANAEHYWKPCTLMGSVVMDLTGEIKARSFGKVFSVGDKDFPESFPANWPDAPVITELLDGWPAMLVQPNVGEPYILGPVPNRWFEPYVWASRFYKAEYGNRVVWPKGYTPVFNVVHSSAVRVLSCTKPQLVLLAVVNNETGMEWPFSAVEQFAKMHHINTPMRVNGQILANTFERGYVLRWDIDGRPPLRVQVETRKYQDRLQLLEAINPLDILMYQRQGACDPWMEDQSYPIRWRFWIRKLRSKNNARYANLKLALGSLWSKCPYKYDAENIETKFGAFAAKEGQPHLVNALRVRRNESYFGTKTEAALWDLVAAELATEPNYLDSLLLKSDGGDT